MEWRKTDDKENKLKNLLYGKANHGRNNLTSEEKNQNTIDFISNLKFDFSNEKILYGAKSTTLYTASGNAKDKYDELFSWKKGLLEQGILSYSDSYFLANWYLIKFPKIIGYLQSRFKYIFVDETQDLEKHQLDLIDKLFYDNGITIIQRVGDINQSIYNSSKTVKIDIDWKTRNEFYLTGSNRLTSEIANVVNNFTLDRQEDDEGNPKFKVEGLRVSDKSIKPHLIIFEDASKFKLQDTFKELITKFELANTDEGKKYGFKIIGWNAKWEDEKKDQSKLRLEDIFPSYKKETKSSKSYFNTLSEYMQYFDWDSKTLENAKNAIIEFLLQVLYLEEKTYSRISRGVIKEVRYNESELLKVLKEADSTYENFKLKLFSWSFSLIVRKDFKAVYDSIKAFVLGEFKELFGLTIKSGTSSLLEESFTLLLNSQLAEKNSKDGFEMEVGTIHSVKGQTHCATMYVETSYYFYETEKLKSPNPLIGEIHNYLDPTAKNISRSIETLKMMYVGFSRPTHLLCFAVMKDNLTDEQMIKMKANGWEKVDLTI